MGGVTPELLAAARGNLRSVHHDLVDKFTAIRARNINFGSADAQGTIDDDDIRRLKAFSLVSSPDVQVTPAVARSNFGGGTMAEMVFRTTFRSAVAAARPYRVIRFVRAAQVNRNFNITKEQHTVPGYVHYDTGVEDRSPHSATQQYFRIALMRSFIKAKWSFDGPREEFRGGLLSNEDTPGTKSSDLPYAITADFLIVLYNETSKQLLEVGHAGASLGVWTPQSTTFVQSLRL